MDGIRRFLRRRRANDAVCVISILAVLGAFAMGMAASVRYDEAVKPENAIVEADDEDARSPLIGATRVIFYYKDGCQYCRHERDELERLAKEHPGMLTVTSIRTIDEDGNVNGNHEDMLNRHADEYGIDRDKVPLTIIGSHVLQGFDDDSDYLEKAITEEYLH